MAICRHLAQSACTGISSMSCGCLSSQSFTSGLCSDDNAAISYFNLDVEHGGADCCCRSAYLVRLRVRYKSTDGVSPGGSRRVCTHVALAAKRAGGGLSV